MDQSLRTFYLSSDRDDVTDAVAKTRDARQSLFDVVTLLWTIESRIEHEDPVDIVYEELKQVQSHMTKAVTDLQNAQQTIDRLTAYMSQRHNAHINLATRE